VARQRAAGRAAGRAVGRALSRLAELAGDALGAYEPLATGWATLGDLAGPELAGMVFRRTWPTSVTASAPPGSPRPRRPTSAGAPRRRGGRWKRRQAKASRRS